MIKIYNSLTGKIEEFKPIKKDEVRMYVCGSTVYNGMHIGNTRPIIFFDVVARFFKYLGYKVTYVSNFTDIDDKIIKKANDEGVSEAEIANRYIKVILGTGRHAHIGRLLFASPWTSTVAYGREAPSAAQACRRNATGS